MISMMMDSCSVMRSLGWRRTQREALPETLGCWWRFLPLHPYCRQTVCYPLPPPPRAALHWPSHRPLLGFRPGEIPDRDLWVHGHSGNEPTSVCGTSVAFSLWCGDHHSPNVACIQGAVLWIPQSGRPDPLRRRPRGHLQGPWCWWAGKGQDCQVSSCPLDYVSPVLSLFMFCVVFVYSSLLSFQTRHALPLCVLRLVDCWKYYNHTISLL